MKETRDQGFQGSLGERTILVIDDSEAVRSVAAYHVGELRLHRLHAPLSKARARTSGLSFDVFARVGELLGEPEPEFVPIGRIS